jgi:hypothetical protein
MRRREFIGLLCGAAGAWTYPDAFAAQKSPKARIGYLDLGPSPPSSAVRTPSVMRLAPTHTRNAPGGPRYCSIYMRSAGMRAITCISRDASPRVT